MSKKRVETIILCEDTQHETFLRRLLKALAPSAGAPRVFKNPDDGGAGDSWVFRRFPGELAALRKAHRSARLVVMVDGDLRGHSARRAEFDEACRSADVPPPSNNEPVLLLVPCRNIETWIAYLREEAVNEEASYQKLKRESDCQPQVAALAEMCRLRQLRSPAPPALEAACRSYRKLPPRR